MRSIYVIMKRLEIYVGQKFNRLTILEELPNTTNGRLLRCKCDCGNIKNILMAHVIRSRIVSCGCYRKQRSTKHGLHTSREYSTWENMIQRCTNPRAKKYYLYGKRGISVCERWLKSFKNFYDDMGSRPDNTTLDRIDNNKGYYKENCKWSTPREQAINVRIFTTPVKYNDILQTIEEWLVELNIDREIFRSRISRGMGYKEALLGEMDIIVLNVKTKQQTVYHMFNYLYESRFNKVKLLELMDCDHMEPYHGYLFRYLNGFKKWPDKYI